MLKKIYNGGIVTVGFLLSPLAWWNDLVINFPISYLMALPFGLLHRDLFIPVFIIGYWLTNIVGFIMMQHGIDNLMTKEIKKQKTQKDFIRVLKISSLYTLLILVLIYFDVLRFPEEFLQGI